MSIEPRPVSEVTPTDLSAGDGTTRKSLPTPISHGTIISVTLDDDVATYNALRDLWRERDLSSGNRIALVDDFHTDRKHAAVRTLQKTRQLIAGGRSDPE